MGDDGAPWHTRFRTIAGRRGVTSGDLCNHAIESGNRTARIRNSAAAIEVSVHSGTPILCRPGRASGSGVDADVGVRGCHGLRSPIQVYSGLVPLRLPDPSMGDALYGAAQPGAGAGARGDHPSGAPGSIRSTARGRVSKVRSRTIGPEHGQSRVNGKGTPAPERKNHTVDQRTDEALVEAYREGEAEALEVLIRRYERELLGFLTRLLGSRAAAEDVFQDTFLQIHLSVESFDVTRRFKPWLFTIAANKGRDYFRKNARQNQMVDLLAPVKGSSGGGDGGSSTSLVNLLDADMPALDTALKSHELREKVRRVVDALPHRAREILLLAYFQKFSYNQIAESLQIPLGTVKSRLHSAVASFAQAWCQMESADDLAETEH